MLVEVTVNGVARAAEAEPRTSLSDFLRQTLELTGTHVGCEHGVCGACTVLVDGDRRRGRASCWPSRCTDATWPPSRDSRRTGALHPLQEAFRSHHALQCGFCTPGILMSVVGEATAGRSLDEVVGGVLDGHLCRCTGYTNLRAAVRAAWSDLR